MKSAQLDLIKQKCNGDLERIEAFKDKHDSPLEFNGFILC
ncbi:MAG: hypothetical protein AVDCRST_MAG96-859 [uncultured Segetibacter sp.]|uniref:Uncharacterized protein n=1 Tax=uncultured Segetibacter sp. TaxID=481133 RepID=A0A6J4RP42_9BACT|nr:MAG: hypothetical protein AVDCRST_MAG96-859 [uncultured Segetibacter sp.]